MLLGVRLVNSLGLSGVANVGYDVGGFAGDASSALFARWISLGAFSPFFRSHKVINAKESQPWSYGEEVEEIAKNYIQLRYNLMPHLYSSFYEATQTGMPVARSLAIDYAHDPKIYDWTYQNQYFFGNGIMVAPFASSTTLGKVYLPEGNWTDLYNDKAFEGKQEMVVETPLNRLPIFVKGGSIIAMQSPVQSFIQQPADTLYLHVYFGTTNNSIFYYEDDGDSYQYEKGDFFKRKITYIPNKNELIL
jgi:alpha-glucosidase